MCVVIQKLDCSQVSQRNRAADTSKASKLQYPAAVRLHKGRVDHQVSVNLISLNAELPLSAGDSHKPNARYLSVFVVAAALFGWWWQLEFTSGIRFAFHACSGFQLP